MKNINKAPSWKVLIAQVAAVGGVLAIMQFVVDKGIVSSLFLASPSQVVTEFFGLLKEGILFDNLGITLLEFFLGFILSIIVGVGLGIIIATVPAVEGFFKPFISITMAIPKVTLIPLLTIWLGIGINSKVIMVFIFAVFSILHNTIAGVKQTSENYLKVARVFEASRLQVVTKVLLPSSMPMIFAGFRVAAANGLVGALFSEMMASKAGLGNLLTKASQLYQTGQLFSIIIIVTLISVIIIQIIDILEKKYFLKWNVN
jgi:NitT/TauT family transport system permease protein